MLIRTFEGGFQARLREVYFFELLMHAITIITALCLHSTPVFEDYSSDFRINLLENLRHLNSMKKPSSIGKPCAGMW